MRLMLVVLIVLSAIVLPISAFAQDDWTCDGGEKDVLAAAQAAFDAGDTATAEELALLTQELCASNFNYLSKASLLINKIKALNNTFPTSTVPTLSATSQDARVLVSEGEDLFGTADYEEALAKYNEAMALFATTEDAYGQAYTYEQMVTLYVETGEFEAEMELYTEWVALLQAHPSLDGFPRKLAEVLQMWGDRYRDNEAYVEAGDTYLLALAQYEAMQLTGKEVVGVQIDLANAYLGINRTEDALSYLLEAQAYFDNISDLSGDYLYLYFELQLALGDTHVQLVRYPDAEAYYQTALELMEDEPVVGQMIAVERLGNLAFYQDDGATAIEYYQVGMTLFETIVEPTNIDASWQGQLLLNIGFVQITQNDYPAAEESFLAVLALAEEFNIPRRKMTAFITLGRIANHNGDSAAALDYYEQALDLAERFHDETRIELIEEYMGEVEEVEAGALPAPHALACLPISML